MVEIIEQDPKETLEEKINKMYVNANNFPKRLHLITGIGLNLKPKQKITNLYIEKILNETNISEDYVNDMLVDLQNIAWGANIDLKKYKIDDFEGLDSKMGEIGEDNRLTYEELVALLEWDIEQLSKHLIKMGLYNYDNFKPDKNSRSPYATMIEGLIILNTLLDGYKSKNIANENLEKAAETTRSELEGNMNK